MNNLMEFAQDRYAAEVLSALNDSLSHAADNPLLKKLQVGTMSLREFGFIMKVRLDAATNFVPFLSMTEEKARKDGTWDEMSSAFRKNLNEELGIKDGTYQPEFDHEVWRARFRSGLTKSLGSAGISLQDIDDRDTTYDIGVFYGDRLKKMPSERPIAALAGAFTVLEGMLEKEFSAVLTFIKARLNGLFESEELKYIAHHARHEHRHFDEAVVPLLKKCTASPHIVPDVIDGIREMEKLRLRDVLERIERNLRKAEPKK